MDSLNQVFEWHTFAARRGRYGIHRGLWVLVPFIILLLWLPLAFGWLGKEWSDRPTGSSMPSSRPMSWLGAALALAALWALGGCTALPTAAGRPPMTAADWLERRDLAAVAHCPPPPLVDEAAACAHLAWDFRK